jgi:hypothetical protein
MTVRSGSGLNVNSLHGARVENRKKEIYEQIKGAAAGFHTSKNSVTKPISREEYANKLRGNQSEHK